MNGLLEMTLPHTSIADVAVTTTPIVDSLTNTSLPEDEQRAIARTLQGDVDAFNELIVKYIGLAYSIAFRTLQTQDAAADAVQESFLKAFRALRSFNGTSFKSWLSRILVNTCYDMIRQEHRLPTAEIMDEPDYKGGASNFQQLVDSSESPQAFVERMELHARIELGVRSLPHEQRLVLALSDIHGYRYDEITKVTGLPMGTVKSRISRARLKLRDFLLEQPELLSADFSD